MFKRIKNLLDISRYTVDELRSYRHTTSGYTNNPPIANSSPTIEYTYTPAQIIDLKADDSFYDSLEQPSDDSTSRN